MMMVIFGLRLKRVLLSTRHKIFYNKEILMKKITELVASDFPSVDKNKFQEWKNAQEERAKKSKIDTPVAIVLILIVVFFKGFLPSLIFGVGLIAVLIYSLPTTFRLIKLQKELGITAKDIRHARKQ